MKKHPLSTDRSRNAQASVQKLRLERRIAAVEASLRLVEEQVISGKRRPLLEELRATERELQGLG